MRRDHNSSKPPTTTTQGWGARSARGRVVTCIDGAAAAAANAANASPTHKLYPSRTLFVRFNAWPQFVVLAAVPARRPRLSLDDDTHDTHATPFFCSVSGFSAHLRQDRPSRQRAVPRASELPRNLQRRDSRPSVEGRGELASYARVVAKQPSAPWVFILGSAFLPRAFCPRQFRSPQSSDRHPQYLRRAKTNNNPQEPPRLTYVCVCVDAFSAPAGR